MVPAIEAYHGAFVAENGICEEDFPTFGRPTSAIFMGLCPASSRALGITAQIRWRQLFSTKATRSPMPRSCSALIAMASGNPSRENSEALSVCLGTSILLTTRMSGLVIRRRVFGELHVHGRHALLSIDDEENYLRGRKGDIHFRSDLEGEIQVDIAADTACIDDGERRIAELALRVDAIACDARHIVYDGNSPAGETVEERALSYIRAANNGDGTFRHGSVKFLRGLWVAMAGVMKGDERRPECIQSPRSQ